jgi:hypothetical protein
MFADVDAASAGFNTGTPSLKDYRFVIFHKADHITETYPGAGSTANTFLIADPG